MNLPEKYQGVNEGELKRRIGAVKSRMGKDLVILAHHYQRDEIFDLADFTGDSFKLASDAAQEKDAGHIVFCGVHFMAEAARILCGGSQRVFLPDMAAGCPMADMASLDDVEEAWALLSEMTDISKIIPVTYMNSAASIKAFCGINDGAVCTSGNAAKIFEWAFRSGGKIFFLPDEHLGRNTARGMGIPDAAVSLWRHAEMSGGLEPDDIAKSRVIVWDGYCHVHTHFTPEHINDARRRYPGCRIIVHPECISDVAKAADATGSTEQIKRCVEAAAAGTTIVVGTEINMVSRLGARNKDKKVIPLSRSLCPNMFKISLADLCWTLEEIGSVGEVAVPEDIAAPAKAALERMLEN